MKKTTKHKSVADAMSMKNIWGPEPTFEEGHTLTSIELSKTLLWYHSMMDLNVAKDYLLTFLKANNDNRYKLIRANSHTAVRPTAGFTARIMSNGYYIEESEMSTFERLIDDSCRTYEEDTEKVIPKVVVSVQDRIASKVSDVISDLEDNLDSWESNKDFSTYDYMNSNQISPVVAEKVAIYYKPLYEEVSHIPKVKELKEAYSHLSTSQLTAYIKFVQSFYEDINRYSGVTKAATVRKTRKSTKKADPLKTFKYLKESNEYKLKSVDANKIIGASEVWLFDVQAFKITVLRSDKHAGISVKGTTFVNYDETRSETKRLRKSRISVLEELIPATKTASKKKFDELSTIPSVPSPRSNDHMIILKVFK